MDADDTFLVLSFVGETRILGMNKDDELEETEIAAFDARSQVRNATVPDYSAGNLSNENRLRCRLYGAVTWCMTSLRKLPVLA